MSSTFFQPREGQAQGTLISLLNTSPAGRAFGAVPCICQVGSCSQVCQKSDPSFQTACSRHVGQPESRKTTFRTAIPQTITPTDVCVGDPDLLRERKNSLFKGITVPLPENEAGTGDVSLRQKAESEGSKESACV